MSQKKSKQTRNQKEKIKELKKDIDQKFQARKKAIWIIAIFVTISIILFESFILALIFKFTGEDISFLKIISAVAIANFLFSFIKGLSKNGKKKSKK